MAFRREKNTQIELKLNPLEMKTLNVVVVGGVKYPH